MIHPRYISFTNAEIVERDDLHRQLGDLADFLWNDPRPHAEGKFDMGNVSGNWNHWSDDPKKALARCGTAACACGWFTYMTGEPWLFDRAHELFGRDTARWMFSGGWLHVDNSPYGASYRIDYYLKHRDPSLYYVGAGSLEQMRQRHYPADAFWMGAPA